MLTAHGVRLDRLDPAAPPAGFCAMIAAIAAAADPHLTAGGRLSPLFRGYRRLARLYRTRLSRAGWNPFDARVNAPTAGRALAVLAVRLGV